MMLRRSVAFASLLVATSAACGGQTAPVDGPSGSTPAPEPGASPPSAAAGNPGAPACRAIPTCNGGDVEVESQAACEPGAACYAQTVCGTTIWCTGVAVCEAYPVCDEGDTQVPGPSACLQDDARCYERAVCGSRIWCTGPK